MSLSEGNYWEYLEVHVDEYNSITVNGSPIDLRNLGLDRWEYAFTMPSRVNQRSDDRSLYFYNPNRLVSVLIFKRPKMMEL